MSSSAARLSLLRGQPVTKDAPHANRHCAVGRHCGLVYACRRVPKQLGLVALFQKDVAVQFSACRLAPSVSAHAPLGAARLRRGWSLQRRGCLSEYRLSRRARCRWHGAHHDDSAGWRLPRSRAPRASRLAASRGCWHCRGHSLSESHGGLGANAACWRATRQHLPHHHHTAGRRGRAGRTIQRNLLGPGRRPRQVRRCRDSPAGGSLRQRSERHALRRHPGVAARSCARFAGSLWPGLAAL